jgi:bifunctional DNA-binding transcriptional regulator/antitoxin component of YhaV-PrlF toxin-antitoxin module
VREYLGVTPGDRIEFTIEDGWVILQSANCAPQGLRKAVLQKLTT